MTCKSLGFPGAIAAIGGAYFGPGTGNVWLDNVFCTGNELFLQSCSFTGFGSVSCPHSRDVGVFCAGMGVCACVCVCVCVCGVCVCVLCCNTCT